MIKTDIVLPFDYTTEDIISAIMAKLPVQRCEINDTRLIRRTLNISDKSNICYNATVGISLSAEREAGLLKMKKKVSLADSYGIDIPKCVFPSRPVVVGAGPAGLFAALLLAEADAKPILIERGLEVEERVKKVNLFNAVGQLDPECNIQFGEGGAGSFSDGKLKVGGMDKYKYKVLCDLVSCGAPEDIVYTVGAHVGTDILRNILQKIRQNIINLGGEVRFSTRLTNIKTKGGRVCAAVVESHGDSYEIDTDCIIMATGHSARDSFEMLKKIGLAMEPKGFGIGLRIEHPREHIDRIMYGDNPPLGIGSSSYHLVTHLDNGRSVYSFCMCPGGSVVAASSEAQGIVTNGMSEHARNGDNSNAAFLVSVTPSDFPSDDPLAGIDLQRLIEQKAFMVAGGSYKAPATTMSAFTEFKSAQISSVKPSYPLGVEAVDPDAYLPGFVTESLRAAIPDFEEWMPGFYYSDAAMTGPETRTTSPVRIIRTSSYEALGLNGLYLAGEGAGYAGGIVSSARDGLMVAESVINKNAR